LTPRALSQPWLHEAVGTAEWTGTPLADLLDEAGPLGDAVEVVFCGADRGVEGGRAQAYERSLSLHDARGGDVLLAYEVNGRPLPPQHGYPLRLVVPGWYGMASVKWLEAATVVAEPFRGYQQERAYRLRNDPDDPGQPVDRIAVRSLLVPPGVPDFFTRRRFLEPGTCEVTGRAWSGHGAVVRVEVSADGGRSWADAEVSPPPAPATWQAWRHRWEATTPGEYELCSRATDAAGHVQAPRPSWNLGGYAVNAVHRVAVTVGRLP
jgi:DMSO/TMAO reductase YedYZ molybdopterin-dependent catalytic subunit